MGDALEAGGFGRIFDFEHAIHFPVGVIAVDVAVTQLTAVRNPWKIHGRQLLDTRRRRVRAQVLTQVTRCRLRRNSRCGRREAGNPSSAVVAPWRIHVNDEVIVKGPQHPVPIDRQPAHQVTRTLRVENPLGPAIHVVLKNPPDPRVIVLGIVSAACRPRKISPAANGCMVDTCSSLIPHPPGTRASPLKATGQHPNPPPAVAPARKTACRSRRNSAHPQAERPARCGWP